MKYVYLACILFSFNTFAANNFVCESIENRMLIYFVDQIGTTDKYELVVREKSGLAAGRVLYRERLTYQDWQGVAEYSGRLTTLIDGDDNEGYVSLTHLGTYLTSTQLSCRGNR